VVGKPWVSPDGYRAARAVLGQDGTVLIPVMTVATSTSAAMGAATVVPPKSFGVGRGFAVLVVIFALMLAAMVLGGHLRASWQRRRTAKQLSTQENGLQ
jgi:hypothetical protein